MPQIPLFTPVLKIKFMFTSRSLLYSYYSLVIMKLSYKCVYITKGYIDFHSL